VTYTQVNEEEEVVYLGDSSATQVLGKGKVLLKLTFEKTLALTECCMFLVSEPIWFPWDY